MVCAVLPLSGAGPSVRSSFTTPLARAGGTGTVVVVRGNADFSTNVASEGVIELAGTEHVDTVTVRGLADRQRLLDGRGRRLISPSGLALRVLHLFGPTKMLEARERVQL